jgi:Flp pilus assembly pilin Flp
MSRAGRLEHLAERRYDMDSSSREEGQALAEYGWTIVLVAILLVVILAVLGAAIFDLWDEIADAWVLVWSRF